MKKFIFFLIISPFALSDTYTHLNCWPEDNSNEDQPKMWSFHIDTNKKLIRDLGPWNNYIETNKFGVIGYQSTHPSTNEIYAYMIDMMNLKASVNIVDSKNNITSWFYICNSKIIR